MIKHKRVNTSCSKEILIRYQKTNAMYRVKKWNKFSTVVEVSLDFGDSQNMTRS